MRAVGGAGEGRWEGVEGERKRAEGPGERGEGGDEGSEHRDGTRCWSTRKGWGVGAPFDDGATERLDCSDARKRVEVGVRHRGMSILKGLQLVDSLVQPRICCRRGNGGAVCGGGGGSGGGESV